MNTAINTVRRVTNRAKREVIARVPPINRLVQSAHDGRVQGHASQLPELDADQHHLLEEVEAQGVSITSVDALGLSQVDEVKAALDRLVGALAATRPGAESALRPSRRDLIADVALWQCGLDPRLLALAENYIGLPVRYYGAAVYREVADGKTLGTRQWHRDIEDQRMFKVLVWLNDVGPRGGALQYIPKPRTGQAVEELHYVSGFVTDEAMTPVVPPEEWVKAIGPRWTAVLADPAQILHRASPAEDRDRYSVTFTWTSRHPVKTMPTAEEFSAADRARIREGLSLEQLACLPPSLL